MSNVFYNLHTGSVHDCSLKQQSMVSKIFDQYKDVINETLDNVSYADMSVQMFELSEKLQADDFKVLIESLLELVFRNK